MQTNFLQKLKGKINKSQTTKFEKIYQQHTAEPGVNSTGSTTTSNEESKKKNKEKRPKQGTLASPHASPQKSMQTNDLLTQLPPIRDAATQEKKKELFIKKLYLCSIICDFHNDVSFDKVETLARERKREILVELIDHLSTSRTWASEDSLKAIIHMINSNLFRPLPPSLYGEEGFDPEEDEPTHDPAWVHLQFVYEFLLRFIVSNNTDLKLLKKFIDRRFLLSIIDLFQSEDPRERDYLKTILHRIYGKFMHFRSFLRKAISHAFFVVIYNQDKHNGLAELLEILGSIINGFATPLKEEHVSFLRSVLMPLHKAKELGQFHAQLAYCVVQFIEKDPTLTSMVVSGLLKFWPITSCSKEILFLSELEEVLELTEQTQFLKLNPLFYRIAACIGSTHFQVAERALFLWNNDTVATFMSDHRQIIFPLLYPALHNNLETHWNTTVHQLTQHIMQQFKDMDGALFEKVEKQFQTDKIKLRQNNYRKRKKKEENRNGKHWRHAFKQKK
ncbi:hypothetical protein RFI_16420 [Reticulomyxa filosa]|uniref:Serine/threonine protein phosphatase 2A regulatory subunit n=1 Tax=Reticulomyxa filosa TaxID=46433 RepID=X6N4F3_RETFI|nr:hypothetical protein RFI_16420 [Reticulomyxa filosa]|eukprot:ETO20798.1 hypothetical protein RFI_16420 [Reticulomyxa filosa]